MQRARKVGLINAALRKLFKSQSYFINQDKEEYVHSLMSLPAADDGLALGATLLRYILEGSYRAGAGVGFLATGAINRMVNLFDY